MTKVSVKVFGPLASLAETSEIEVEFCEGMTVRDLLNKMIEWYGKKFGEVVLGQKTGHLPQYISIFVNQTSINFLGGLRTPLQNGDVVLIFHPVGGG